MNNPNEPGLKSGSKLKWWKKIPLLIFLIFVIALVLLAVLDIVLPATLRYTMISKIENFKQGESRGAVLLARQPKPLSHLSQSKTIKASEGGKITVTDERGSEAELVIFPNSLKNDTKITLTPLAEIPISNYGESSLNGILIEPKDVKLSSPAIVTFTLNPLLKPKTPFDFSPSPVGEGSGTPNINLEEIMRQAGVVYGTSTKPMTEDELKKVVMWVINHTSADGNSNVDTQPGSGSNNGNSVSGPVGGGGTYSPDVPDEGQAKKITENETGKMEGGTCGYDDMQNILWLIEMNQQVPGGDANALLPTVEKCAEKMIEALRQKCAQDKIQTRRKEFLELLQLLKQLYSSDHELVKKLLNVMHSCVANYEFKGTGQGYSNVSLLTYNISAEICGFLDDREWRGKVELDIESPLPGGGTHWTHSENSFTSMLAPKGGPIVAEYGRGSGYVAFAGRRFNVSIPAMSGSLGIFDGDRTVSIELPVISMPTIPIKIKNSCEDPKKGSY